MANTAKAASVADEPTHAEATTRGKNRTYPNLTLEKALTVARAIQDGASGTGVKRLTLAKLIRHKPESSSFTQLLQASRMYGLTSGGVHAPVFELTELGETATGPDEDARQLALQTAVLSIEPYKTFLTAFSTKSKRIPGPDVCRDLLVTKANVPTERADECLQYVLADARFVGFIQAFNGNEYVDLQGATLRTRPDALQERDNDEDEFDAVPAEPRTEAETPRLSVVPRQEPTDAPTSRDPILPKKVFIGHGKDHGPLEQVKKMLDQVKVKYAVAVDEPNKGRPISAKVASMMRDQCSSAIFIFTADEHFQRIGEHGDTEDVWRPSENAIYELGAAAILYDQRIVIFKDRRVKLPTDFSDLGFIPFEEGKIEMQMGQLLGELVGLDILEFRAKG